MNCDIGRQIVNLTCLDTVVHVTEHLLGNFVGLNLETVTQLFDPSNNLVEQHWYFISGPLDHPHYSKSALFFYTAIIEWLSQQQPPYPLLSSLS
jgi:hypothetical protein